MKTFATAALMSLVSLPVHAAVLDYTFSATLSADFSTTGPFTTDTLVDDAVAAGTLTGTLSFSTAPGTLPDTATARSYAAPTITFNEIDTSAIEALPNFVFVVNDSTTPVLDSVVAGFPNFTAPGIVDAVSFAFIDSTQTAFSSLDFPALLDLAAFTSTELNIFSTAYDTAGNMIPTDSESAQFTFTALTPVAPVPLPAGGALLLTALGALTLARRRQRTIKR